MPTITINKKDFEKLLGKKLPLDKLKDRISMLGTDLDSIEGNTITVEVFPNRPDLLSEEGLARALSSFIGHKTGLKQYKVKKSSYKAKIDKKTQKVRPYAVAAVVKNIKLDDPTIESLMQLQEKIHTTHGRNRKKVSVGVYDLSAIKFPLTYTTKPKSFKFTPLEMDKELTLLQILQRHPKGRDYAHLLENFNEFPIWIDAKKQVLSMPPIINSEETKVKPSTKNLFIDVTGLDEKAVEEALNIIVTALAERKADIYEVKIGNKSYPDLKPKEMKLDLNYTNKTLGLALNPAQLKKLLEKMGFGIKANKVLIPAYRTDILHPIDLVEDIAIAYGYENFEEEIPKVATIAEEDKNAKLYRKIAEILVGLKFLETNTYHITSKDNLNKKMNAELPCIKIENALTKDYNVLRSWLIPSLMQVLNENTHNEYPQIIFEIGTVFKEKEEVNRLAVLITHTKANYTEIKQVLDVIMNALNFEYKIEETEHNSFIPGRVGRVIVKGEKVAYIGELHPAVLQNWKLEMPVAALELNLTDLFKVI